MIRTYARSLDSDLYDHYDHLHCTLHPPFTLYGVPLTRLCFFLVLDISSFRFYLFALSLKKKILQTSFDLACIRCAIKYSNLIYISVEIGSNGCARHRDFTCVQVDLGATYFTCYRLLIQFIIMTLSFKGQTVVVTGAGGGLGRAYVYCRRL